MEFSKLYRECLKYITYIPGNGYLWIDAQGEWHGLYETEETAVAHFIKYLNETDLTPFVK